jgi:hypothetical protein
MSQTTVSIHAPAALVKPSARLPIFRRTIMPARPGRAGARQHFLKRRGWRRLK